MPSPSVMLAIGLVIGGAVGAGAMYLAIGGRDGAAPVVEAPDAGVEAPAVAKKGKKKRRRGGGGGGGGAADERVEVDPEIVLTAADRAMSWKGDSVEKPPASLDMAGEGEARALDSGEIDQVIGGGGGEALRDCVVDAVGGAPFSGEVTVKMLVDGSGAVTKARVHAPAFMHKADVLGCVRRASKRMRFAAVGGYTVVTVPFPISL